MSLASQLLSSLNECKEGDKFTIDCDGTPCKVVVKEVADGEAVVAKLGDDGKEMTGDDAMMSVSISDLESTKAAPKETSEGKDGSKCSFKSGGTSKAKFKKHKPAKHLSKA